MSARYRPKHDAGLKPENYAMTFAEIGRELGITKERSRQIEAKALRKAKQILEQRGFTLQDLLLDEEQLERPLPEPQDLLPEGEHNG